VADFTSSALSSLGIGGAIGKAIVSLELDTKKYLGEMQAAEGQTVASTKAMGTSTSQFGQVAKTAMLGAGVAVVAFGAFAVKSFLEAQKVMAQTEAVLESTGGAANVTKDQVLTLAEGLRDLTGVDDDAVQASENLLLTFTAIRNEAGKGNDIFNQTEKAVVDMATAMNHGAIPSLEQLSSTTIQVGKALNDPISGMTALRRVGVRFTEDQVKLITRLQQSGDLMGAQKLILEELTLEFGGAGKAAGQTMAGQMAILGSKFQDVAEDVGEALMPTLQGLLEILEALVPVLKAVFDGITLAFSADTYTDIPVVGEAFHILGVGIQAVKDAVDTSDASVRANIDTMNEQAGAISQTEKECRKYADALKEGEGAAVSAGTEWTRLSKTGKEIADNLKAELPDIIGTVTKWKEVFSLSPGELRKIADTWVRIGKTMLADLRELADSDLKPAMKEAIAALPPEMRHAWAEGNAKEKRAIQASIRDAYDIQDELAKIANNAAGAARSVGQSIASGIALGITTSSELITTAAAGAVHRAIEAAKEAGKIHSPSEEMMKVGAELARGLEQGILKNTQKAVDAAKSMLDKVIGAASSFRSGISGGISGFADLGGAFGSGELPLSEVIAAQVGGASQLASILQALKAQGASKGLLSQVAQAGAGFGQALLQGGPAQIEEANAALKTIADLAQQTGKGLSEAFFGDRVDKLKDKMQEELEELRDIKKAIRELEHGHDVILDGERIAITVRKKLLQTSSRNGDVGLS